MVATSVSLDELLAKKLNAFQKKVIDLSSRNPLVNTNLSLRSAAIVRVVDELPEVLAYYLRQQKTMSFRPLPPIEENNPKDEQNAKFKSYLDALKAEDEEYIDFMADQKGAQVASPEELEEAERKIRDKVRVILKLPPRKSKLSLNLEQHAIDNGVDPSYELPFSKDKDLDKHVDDDIQTLLLPNDLDRRLTNLLTKCRTWEEETGINAFHAAFGFLRWQDTGAKDRLINSPLILQPVKLELRRSARGSKFFVRADGDDYALNFVLYEKLKLELALELPLFGQGDKVEDYFAKVREAISGRDKWEVSRQVVFGVFPSAKMAIYHDLDPAKGFYANNQVINELILGRQRDYAETASPLYDLDQEDIERVVFPLVLSADSSQASAIYDALTGKNMALEGPPGTGKSQSIVNVIASALRKGLKVLFVAEKMAALEVVKSRLEAIGLGNFLLPLQANRSDRAQVIAGIRYRIEMPKPNRPFDATHLHGQFELARSRLKGYLALMDAPFGQSGLTVREVIGRFRATDETLPEAPKALESPDIQDIESLGETRARELLRAASDLEKAASDAHASAPYWQGVTVTDLDAFSAKRAKDLALELSVALSAALGRKAEMASFALDDLKDSEIEMALCFLGQMVPAYPSLEKGIIDSLKTPGDMAYLEDFICKCAQCQGLGRGLGAIMESPGDPGTIERLGQAIKLANDQGFKSLSLEACHQELEAMHQRLEGLRQDLANLGPVVAAWPLAAGYSMKSLGAAREFVSAYDSRVLTLRAQAPPDNVLLGQLQALASKGLSLKGEKDKLAGMFPLRAAPGKIPDPESLASAASELEKTGLLNRLSGGYRRAKALYLSLANTQGFVPARASQELRELAAYLSEKSALEQNPTLGSFFPSLYVGLDSDFSLMLASASYYQQINLRYPGILNQEIKNLLYSADSDLLASIPPLRCQGQENYPALAKAKGELETVYGQALATYEGLARLLGPGQANGQGFAQARPLVTADYQAINQFIASFSAQFPGLASQAPDYPGLGAAKTLFWLGQKYQELNNSLAADEKARSILGAKFQGPETSRESLGGELEAIKLIEGAGPNGQDLYRALNNERFRELPGILGDIQGKLKEAQKAMASLASLTGLDLGPAMEALDDADKPARAAALADDQAGLFAFSALAKAKERAVGLGLGWFVSAYESEGAPMKNLAKILEASIYRAMMLKVRETHNSELLAFTSQELNYQRESLAQSDNALAKWARQDLSSYLFDSARPPMGNSVGLKKDYTETALLLNEIGKKKQYIPVRALVSRAHKSLL
ncbi:MAG: DUF4011 domain-containing protein, partial [Deltaproteobacteria bacterium]|nr:DUF4011 domain-containing protein [Deltaproteobacteria bacterium]